MKELVNLSCKIEFNLIQNDMYVQSNAISTLGISAMASCKQISDCNALVNMTIMINFDALQLQ